MSLLRCTAMLLGLALLLPGGAAGETGQAPSAAPAATATAAPEALDPVSEAIRELTDHLRYQGAHDPGDHALHGEHVVLGETVARYYEAQQFRPRWQDPAWLDRLLVSLNDLANDGLRPADYHFEALEALRAQLQRAGRLPDGEQAALDVLATDAMMLGLYHLYLGRVDPEKLSPQWNFASRPVSVERGFEALTRALEAGAIRETFDRARPQHPWYQRGRERLKEYRALAAAGGWPNVPMGPTIKLGMEDPRVPTLRARLLVTRDYPAGSVPTAQGTAAPPAAGEALGSADTPADAASSDRLYDASLEAAVRGFQERHGLAPDGVLGRRTMAALNEPLASRVTQIELALERLRWLPEFAAGPAIAINVPSFQLWAFDDARDTRSATLSMPVIVGKAVKHETPMFIGSMRAVEFSPYWNVPRNILRNETLPRLARDPGYLEREEMELVSTRGDGRLLTRVDAAALEALRAGELRVRQRPGARNALGGVKFVLPNTMEIYLHGTPARELFERTRRDFSHGCIRVRDPAALAAFVLQGRPEWTAEAIDAAMTSGRNRTVALERAIPVVVFYTTAVVDSTGRAVFLPDVYGHDRRLLSALGK